MILSKVFLGLKEEQEKQVEAFLQHTQSWKESSSLPQVPLVPRQEHKRPRACLRLRAPPPRLAVLWRALGAAAPQALSPKPLAAC